MIRSNSIEYKNMTERLKIISSDVERDMEEIYSEYASLTISIGKTDSIETIIGKFTISCKGFLIE